MTENNSKIEDIKRRLYEREDTISERPREGVLHQVTHKAPEDWQGGIKKADDSNQNKNMKKPSTSIFKYFFILAVVFFIAAIGYAIYMFSNGGVSVSNDNIDITVLGNAFAKGGEELPLQVEIVNRNKANLELANLIVEYPKGADDNSTDVVRLPYDSIGTIKPGQSVTRDVKVTLFGTEQSTRNIKISLEYHPEGSNAIFSKDTEYPITISSAPLSLNIDTPTSISSNQPFSFNVTATLNTTLPTGNTILQVAYPSNFIFDSAIPAPSIGNSVWDLSSLTLTNPIPIIIKGRLVGQDGDEQVFHVYAGATNKNNQSIVSVVYNSLLQTILISKPFLEARILVNSQDLPEYIASGGGNIHAEISWANNLSTKITDAQIIASISGNVLDKSSVSPSEGFYDSVNSQIIWDKNSIPELGSIEPGARGNISFNFKSLSLVGLSTVIKDPQIILDVSIKGRQPSEGSTFGDVNNFNKKVIKILSDFQIASSANYSSGEKPPKAESETRYNVNWTLSNSANIITSAQARSVLPIYVNWVGVTKGSTENITYNEITREVIWNIGTVKASTGFGSTREASFQISLKPSTSQIGSVPQLMKDIYLSGTDSFTSTLIKSTRGPITTTLINDPSFQSGDDRVVR
jgi:hypothetical protein